MSIDRMVWAQLDLQVDSFGKDPTLLTGEERVEFIRWNVLALTDELHEMLNEVGWKPWASSRHVNEEAAFKEMVDAWHFFMNILLAIYPRDKAIVFLGPEFERAYMAKRKVNGERQALGYDGVTGKCSICHRDLKEAEMGALCVINDGCPFRNAPENMVE